MKKSVLVKLSAVCTTMILAITAAGRLWAVPVNLIVNGSFEDPVEATMVYAAGPGPTGWTVGTGGGVHYHEPDDGSAASDGDRLWDVSGNGVDGRISQSFATAIGQSYDVYFDFAALSNGTGYTAAIDVNVASQTFPYSRVTSGPSFSTIPYTAENFSFEAISTSSTLEFVQTSGGPNYFGAFIDNVRVFEIVQVPEPSSLLLLGMGSLTLVRFPARRRRRTA